MKLVTKILTMTLVSVLALSLIPIAADSPASANPTGVAWTKYTGELNMGGLKAVADSWVIKDGATYKMWFTRLTLNETATEILTRLNNLGTSDLSDFIDDILAKDLDSLLDRAATLAAADVVGLLDSVTTVIGYATSSDGINWIVQNNNVLSGGSSILSGVGTPTVVNISGTYHMWYTKGESDLTSGNWGDVLDDCDGSDTDRKSAVETVLNGVRTVIGHATSTNGGLTWVNQNNQVFPTTDGNLGASVGAPCVVYDGTYKMWYTRTESDLTISEWANALTDTGNADFDAAIGVLDGTAAVIGYATSNDGLTWNIQNSKVLPSSTPAWQSVGDPCVVKVGSTYHMWYTGASTNLTVTGVGTVWSQLLAFNFADIWTALAAKDVGDLLDAILALDLTTIKTTLSSTSTTIGYATSGNGTTWAVQNSSDLAGSTGSPWSSVGAPTVIESGGSYEMWFTEGINDLTVGKLADIYLGSDLPIGRATAAPSTPPYTPPYIPPYIPPAEEEEEVVEEILGVTYLSEDVVKNGLFLAKVTATAKDEQSWVTVPEGTTGLTAEGEPLTFISAVKMEVPPPPPPYHSMVALTYTFGPEGATFDQPVGITLTYSEAGLPADFDEEDLVIVVWDEVAGEWVKLETVVDTVNNTVTTYVTHFSTFTVLAAIAPASFQISNLTVMPDEVEIDEDVTISVLVENTGDLSGSYILLELKINSEVADTKEISLAGHGSVTVSFTISAESAGTYAISINGLTGRFTVTAPPVIEPPKPADIIVSNLSVSSSKVEPGDTVTISVLVANRGGQEGTYLIELKIDGVVVETKSVTLAAGASETVTFTTSEDMGGIYTVDIDDQSTSFTVVKPEIEKEVVGTNWPLIGGIIGGVVVIAIIVGILLWRRRRY